MGCEFPVSVYCFFNLTLIICFYFLLNALLVFLDMGRKTNMDKEYFTFQAGRWEVFTVSVSLEILDLKYFVL